MNLITLLFCIILLATQNIFAESKYEKESEVITKDTSKFTISSGWFFDINSGLLQSPEKELSAHLMSTKIDKFDAEKLSLDSWKKINPNFNYKVFQKASPPARDGWEQIHQIVYEVPTKESRTVLTLIRIYKGTAYILLVDSTNSGLEKRGAQFQIVANTWKPNGFIQEDFSKKKPTLIEEKQSSEIDNFAQQSLKDLQIPGATIGIIQNGRVVFRKNYGVKQLGKKELVDDSTMFMIGSTTKPLTTLMTSKLVELKKINWETPIYTVLPDFALADDKVTPKVLMKHSACACTGMPRRDLDFVFGSVVAGPEQTLKQMSLMRPTTGFGETFQYSNHLVAVGGFASANAYNKGKGLFEKYENAMEDLIFGPLEMLSTRVKPKESDLLNLASPHSLNFSNKMSPFPQKIDDMVYPVAPAGSIWSTRDDLLKYVSMELNWGKNSAGKQLYSKEQIKLRRTPGVKVDDATTYGLGLFVENEKGVLVVGHGGNTLGFTADMLFLPEHNVGMVVLMNASGTSNAFRSAMKQKLMEILFGAEVKSMEIVSFANKNYKEIKMKLQSRVSVTDTSWIGSYVGKYENKELGEVEIKKTKNGLEFVTPRWVSPIGSAKEDKGDRLISLLGQPWSGGFEMRVQNKPKMLVLDDSQVKYEFKKID